MELSVALARSAEDARQFLKLAKAANTLRAYRADWNSFERWCADAGIEPLPADAATLALYLTEQARNKKVSTLTRRMTAIRQAHQVSGYASPTSTALVSQLMAGIRRSKGTAVSSKQAVLVDDLKRMVALIPDSTIGLRDRAVLLVGFTGAFRRSELAGIDCGDLFRDARGVRVAIRRSKTDPEGQGRVVAIPLGNEAAGTCPVAALEAWLRAAGIQEGPVFRPVNKHSQIGTKSLSGAGVAIVVKRWAKALGHDPAEFAGHSLRAGLATSAAIAGKPERIIMQQTGHRSLPTVRRYIRDGNLFRENAAEGLGL